MGTFYSDHANIRKVAYFITTSPAKKECEDALMINDSLGIYGVLDGATPIDDFKDENGHNGAYLAANLFKNHIESLKGVTLLPHEILQANQLLNRTMESYGINQSEKDKLWCTCVSAVQIKEGNLLYASLGDTMILTCDTNGNVNVLTVDTVKNISARAQLKRHMDRYHDTDIPKEDYFKDKRNRISYHRYMANKPNGYSVANGMKEVKNYIQYGMLDIRNLKHVLIMSDGLFDPKGDLRHVYWEIAAHGLEAYVSKLSADERDKKIYSDDKAAVLLSF
ncbi:protein phosphatase 2C domain-containing protein [Lentibacillus sp. L22]|uniref:protein phosphatase 2C domain-containing protein n=1 Tax=Lentibacillus TaxID=175304 RepID=UPI0022B1BBC3|nr:protein phosphatase 2C domain-containing protein [Lentibacillus daqui]